MTAARWRSPHLITADARPRTLVAANPAMREKTDDMKQ
jgi:hypothetical protein